MHEPAAAALRALLSDTERLYRLQGPAVGRLDGDLAAGVTSWNLAGRR